MHVAEDVHLSAGSKATEDGRIVENQGEQNMQHDVGTGDIGSVL